jgi:hypothetical protein
MSKPLGMTVGLQILRPTKAEDAIWKSVEEAIISGMTPEQFLQTVREAWAYERDEQKKMELEKFKEIKNAN